MCLQKKKLCTFSEILFFIAVPYLFFCRLFGIKNGVTIRTAIRPQIEFRIASVS
jgi:hypothetical protein